MATTEQATRRPTAPTLATPGSRKQQVRTSLGNDTLPEVNVGDSERMVSIAAGAILALEGLGKRNGTGLFIAGVGAALIYRGATGRSPVHRALGIDTANGSSGRRNRRPGIHVSESFLINKPPDELYSHWRKLENLPKIMSHLLEVRQLGANRSHWVVKAPAVAGGKVEWDAETTIDDANSRIAWRSLPGADVNHSGEVRFSRAPGDRGTAVHVSLDYSPPGGQLGHWVAKLFGEAADQEIRDDLRKFKRVMEIGEAPTVEGQPRGTCMHASVLHSR